MRNVFILFFLIISLVTSAQGILDELNVAFESKSGKKWISFLDKWNDDIKTIGEDEILELSAPEVDVYDLFRLFYNPLDVEQYCTDEEDFNPFTRNVEQIRARNDKDYYVVQNEIKYVVLSAPTIKSEESRKSYKGEYKVLHNFRPIIENGDKKILYLTVDYKNAFNSFIGVSKEGVTKKVAKKFSFIEKQLSPQWDLSKGTIPKLMIETVPEVTTIYFNQDLTEAILIYNLFFLEGEAYYKKESNKWIEKHIWYTTLKN